MDLIWVISLWAVELHWFYRLSVHQTTNEIQSLDELFLSCTFYKFSFSIKPENESVFCVI